MIRSHLRSSKFGKVVFSYSGVVSGGQGAIPPIPEKYRMMGNGEPITGCLLYKSDGIRMPVSDFPSQFYHFPNTFCYIQIGFIQSGMLHFCSPRQRKCLHSQRAWWLIYLRINVIVRCVVTVCYTFIDPKKLEKNFSILYFYTHVIIWCIKEGDPNVPIREG